MIQQPLEQLAHEIAQVLMRADRKVVFAESCTGGLISATLARVPGVSKVHCGSAVVYRLNTKTSWLDVPSNLLDEVGAVSEPVARFMAEGVLNHTPEAEIAVSITGHLGPGAPDDQDGLIFVGIAVRGSSCRILKHVAQKYGDHEEFYFPGETAREQRQWAAVEFVFTQLAEMLRH